MVLFPKLVTVAVNAGPQLGVVILVTPASLGSEAKVIVKSSASPYGKVVQPASVLDIEEHPLP